MDPSLILFHHKRHPCGDRPLSNSPGGRCARGRVDPESSALLFLYRAVLGIELGRVEHLAGAQTPLRVPVVLTLEEVRAVVKELRGTPALVVQRLCGAGLRLQEALRLRIKDIDFTGQRSLFAETRGRRIAARCCQSAIEATMAAHPDAVRAQHQRDLAVGLVRVPLPGALDRKFPNAGTE